MIGVVLFVLLVEFAFVFDDISFDFLYTHYMSYSSVQTSQSPALCDMYCNISCLPFSIHISFISLSVYFAHYLSTENKHK